MFRIHRNQFLVAVATALVVVGCENQRRQEERERAVARQLREQAETLAGLREQMEREQCQEFVRLTVLASGVPEDQPVYEMMTVAVCANPESAIRQRLRSAAGPNENRFRRTPSR